MKGMLKLKLKLKLKLELELIWIYDNDNDYLDLPSLTKIQCKEGSYRGIHSYMGRVVLESRI